jgi:oligoribonuclease NrnB/cAMP/cGMP phosphodiesterase (DHH superfamily)
MNERTVIMYHGDCPDGFGGAYAAWKKFGDSAEYIPLHRGDSVPEELDGADVYMLDYTFNTIEEMKEAEQRAASLTVIDHHEGIREITEAMPNHVYDADHSGAVLSWMYFHPNTEIPRLLAYVEDDDIFRFELPETKPFMSYLIIQPMDFKTWDDIVRKLEDPEERRKILEKASAYR